ncbi:MAG TPA: hypothetical protein VHK69_10495, partial [Chitinophagaceae bacterium]|nr:hypothetical protein [Chitinophagaceae bacterium]
PPGQGQVLDPIAKVFSMKVHSCLHTGYPLPEAGYKSRAAPGAGLLHFLQFHLASPRVLRRCSQERPAAIVKPEIKHPSFLLPAGRN